MKGYNKLIELSKRLKDVAEECRTENGEVDIEKFKKRMRDESERSNVEAVYKIKLDSVLHENAVLRERIKDLEMELYKHTK